LTIVELLAAYWPHAENYYRKHGEPTGSLDNILQAVRPLKELYGELPVREFGPLKLKQLREWMISQKAPSGETPTRSVINERVRIIRKVFEWGVSEELVPETVYRALKTVAGLQARRSRARDPKPVRADMVRFQRLTGCRPGKVCLIRPCDFERFDRPKPLFATSPAAPLVPLDVWIYRPARHKTGHHGKQKRLPLGREPKRSWRCICCGRTMRSVSRRRKARPFSASRSTPVARRPFPVAAGPAAKTGDAHFARALPRTPTPKRPCAHATRLCLRPRK
jgi:hypothetical protein